MAFEQLNEFMLKVNDVFYNLAADVDLEKRSFIYALSFIAFNPIFWNTVARLAFGSPKRGCYALALTIFSLGICRDLVYERALKQQPSSMLLLGNEFLSKYLSVILFGAGNILVLSSMYALGITGTYLGDYFGILMDHRVTGFPFNVSDNPMYQGSTLCFLGTALWYGKPAGLFATLFVHLMYNIALTFEEPFTAKIYAEKQARENEKKTN